MARSKRLFTQCKRALVQHPCFVKPASSMPKVGEVVQHVCPMLAIRLVVTEFLKSLQRGERLSVAQLGLVEVPRLGQRSTQIALDNGCIDRSCAVEAIEQCERPPECGHSLVESAQVLQRAAKRILGAGSGGTL
eukprot:CAMPEP_0174763170 /NCGR_PEP_ID=MMETSP1094-20130205/110145_1 /TAXON_ID=156173 /ORGANISM="Chrysochromulina brevifilum, Strain UTEX LB 985" /LENGTH=133 /DNA_ID=CAMNT_0015969127 /DNA_START=525 /DNA_END=922 /DNA_ORIENTATION=+